MMFSRKKTSPGIDFKVALDAVQTPIMMVDREMKITYVNQGSIRLINENMEVFRQIWPSFNSNNIIVVSLLEIAVVSSACSWLINAHGS